MSVITVMCLRWVWLLTVGAGIAVLLVGCGRGSPPATPQEKLEPGVTKYDLGTFASNVYEFTLRDGTRCVMHYRGGIACEWKK